MTLLDRLAANRNWGEAERLVLDQVHRIADEVIAPAAAAYDAEGTFPQKSMAAIMKDVSSTLRKPSCSMK